MDGIAFEQLIEICKTHELQLKIEYTEIENCFEIEVIDHFGPLSFYRKRTKFVGDFVTYFLQHIDKVRNGVENDPK